MADTDGLVPITRQIGTAGFGDTADTSSITAPSPPAPQGWGQMVGDIGKEFIGSSEQQIGDIGRTIGYNQFADDWTKSGQDWTSSVSPAGQEITNAPLFSSETLQHPLSKTLMGAAKGGLWNAAALIPGGGLGAMAARGAIGGTLGYTSAYGGVYDTVNNTSDDQLQRSSPTYMELRKTLPEYDAKQALVSQAWNNMPAYEKAAIVGTGALAGEAGPLATAGKFVTSAGGKTLANLASGRLARTGIGALETGGIQAGQYLGTAIPTREALSSVGVPTDTDQQIATGAIEQGTIGAIIGGAARGLRRPPVGGENVTGVITSKMGGKGAGASVTVVPAGKSDPAESAALQSTVGQVPPIMDFGPGAMPIGPDVGKLPGGMPEPTGPSSPVILGMGKVPDIMDAGTGITRIPQVPKFPGGMPPPSGPSEPIMPKLPGGMPEPTGPSEPINRPPIPFRPRIITPEPTPASKSTERVSEPEPEPTSVSPAPPTSPPAPTKGPKAPVTKVSEPEPTPAITKVSEPEPTPAVAKATKVSDLPPDIAAAIDKAKNVGDVVKQLNKVEKTPKAPSIEQAKIIEDWKQRMKRGGEPPTEPTAEPIIKPTEGQAPVAKAETKRLAAIQKLVGEKETPAQVVRPTVEPSTEPTITKLPPTSAMLGGIKPSDKAKAIVAKFAPKGEAPIKEPTVKLKKFDQLKAAIAAKQGTEPPVTGKIAAAIKAVLPAKAQAAIDKAKAIEEAKKNVHPNPTDAQKVAGNFKQGHPPASATQGQTVTIHSPAGEKGQAEGKILGTSNNIPKEHLETILRSPDDTGKFYVINKIDPNTGRFAGHIAVQGADNMAGAVGAYFNKLARDTKVPITTVTDKEPTGGVVEMTPEEFEHFKQNRNPEEPVYPSTEGKHPFGKVEVPDKATGSKTIDTLGSQTIKTALQEALRKVPNTIDHAIYRKLAQQIIKYLPDIPLYDIKQSDLERLAGPGANASYSARRNYILRGTRIPTTVSPELVLLHEALHAATTHLYYASAKFRDKVDIIAQEYLQGVRNLPLEEREVPYTIRAQDHGPELLAELSNPYVAQQLAKIQMSDKLANDLNMSTWAKATKTLWGGIVKAFKDGLENMGMKIPGKDDLSKHTLLDGLLRLTDEGFVARSKSARTDFAKMSKAMQAHSENMSSHAEAEHNSQQNIYNTVHDVVEHPEKMQAHYDSEAKSLSGRASDLIDKLPRGVLLRKAYEYIIPFQGSDSLRMDKEHLWGKKDESNDFRKWGETNLRRDGYHTSLTSAENNTIHDMYAESRRHTKAEAEHFADTSAQATAYHVDPRYKIGEGTNAWMKSPGWAWRNEARQAIANYDKVVKMYNDMHPDFQSRFTKLVDEYRAAGVKRANIAVNELIDSITNAGHKFLQEPKKLDLNDPADVEKQSYIKWHNDWEQNWDKNKEVLKDHLLNGKLEENEEQWLKERGFDDISDIQKLANPRGPYVPLDHAGQFGINGEYKIEKPANATQVADKSNVFDFKTEEEAEAFYNKQPPNSHMTPVYFNDEGKEVPRWEKWQKSDGSVGYAKDNKAWRVEVNNKYYSGHDGISAANRRYQQLKDSGAFAKLSLPQSKRTGWYQGIPVSSPLFNHLMSAVDKRTDYTDAQKEAVKNLLRDTALSSLEGNRVVKHMIPRKAVAGWDTDYIKTYKSYFDAHNALISRVEYSKDMNAAVNGMIKYADDHQGEEGATERGYILDELNKRDNFFGSPNYRGEEENKFAGRVLKFAEAMSFFAHMVSPGHLITHQTHQFLTYDLAAAKYGPFKAALMAGRMHSIMAGTGFRNVMRSVPEMMKIITKDSKGLNYVEGLMDKMSQHPRYGADLIRMLNEAIATNRLHPDQGFDASVLHMGSGKLERGLARLDLASRQMMGATEAYSRIWGYSTVYALARDAGETHEQATRTAFDSVSRTQGLLSRSNMSSRMNKWWMRAPMQFRGWGLNMMYTLANNIYNIFKPDAPGVRAEAVRRLLYLFGSTAALTGINGLPSDPMRIGLALAGALGLNNYNWSDAQNDMREFFTKETGSPAMANFMMNGLLGSLGPFSFFGADRVGFGSLLVYGEPSDYSKGSISEWLLSIMGGAPFGEVSPMHIGEGVKALQEGNYAKATEVFMPLKLIDDWAKAWQGAYEGIPTKGGVPGMTPYSPGETFMQSMGLTPIRRQQWGEGRQAMYRENQALRTETSELLDTLGNATTAADRTKAQMQIAAFNLRNPEARITTQDVSRAIKRQTAPSMLGYTVTRRNRSRLEELQRAYEAY